MSSAADTYIEAQVRSALIEVFGFPDGAVATSVAAAQFISALNDHDIELKPR
jgi:hypothetical protein